MNLYDDSDFSGLGGIPKKSKQTKSTTRSSSSSTKINLLKTKASEQYPMIQNIMQRE